MHEQEVNGLSGKDRRPRRTRKCSPGRGVVGLQLSISFESWKKWIAAVSRARSERSFGEKDCTHHQIRRNTHEGDACQRVMLFAFPRTTLCCCRS